jgi:hypothetical protein
MVQVTVSVSVKVGGGPTMPLSSTLTPASYTYATAVLEAAGDPVVVDLLPGEGTVALLALSAKGPSGVAAPVTVLPLTLDGADGVPLTVDAPLLVANADVLAALALGGPRSLRLTNPGSETVTVEILTGLAATGP